MLLENQCQNASDVGGRKTVPTNENAFAIEPVEALCVTSGNELHFLM